MRESRVTPNSPPPMNNLVDFRGVRADSNLCEIEGRPCHVHCLGGRGKCAGATLLVALPDFADCLIVMCSIHFFQSGIS